MVIVPDSEIILLQSPLKLDNNNQITFASKTAQYNYFYSLNKMWFPNVTYVRKDNVVRIQTRIDPNDTYLPTFTDILTYNYCMYKNTSYNDKWFYAWITDVKYQNDGMTEITIDTDAFQTWQFDLTFMNSFIEREHVSDDTIGLHTIPESLEHGPYIMNMYSEMTEWKYETSKVIVGTTWLPSNTPNLPASQIYGGCFSGVYYMAFNATNAKNFILALDGLGRGSSIVTIFMAPNDVCVNLTTFTGTIHSKINNDDGTTSSHDFTITGSFIGNNLGGNIIINDTTITKPSAIDGYTPKNNKMWCYPYNYILLTNNQGSNAEFHYEDFISNTPTFKCVGTLNPGCSIKMFPVNYKKLADNASTHPGFNAGIMAGKFPICSWQNDSFTNWMTQQSVNHTLGVVSGVAQVGEMFLNSSNGQGNTSGAYAGLFNQQARHVSERYQHALVPPQASGNINGGDVSFAYGEGNFAYCKMYIKAEYAKIIDDFFSEFGYQVNRLATPNIHKRSNWDYMKTTSVNIEGNVPEKDLDKVRALFDSGCTFWHTTSHFLDYSQTNSIL